MKQTLSQRLAAAVGTLAVVAAVVTPVAVGAATQTGSTIINATVNPVLSLSTSGTVAIALTPTASGVVSSNSDTVTVSTNRSAGYTLSIADNDATTTLGDGSGNTLAASSGTKTATTALAVNTWGWAVANGTTGIGTNTFDVSYTAENSNGSSTTKWAGMPASGSGVTIKATAATASNDTTAVWYGVKVDTTKPSGVYSDTVTYTGVTN